MLELESEELASCLHFLLQPLTPFSLAELRIPSASPPPFYGTDDRLDHLIHLVCGLSTTSAPLP